jgi:hypothetical protein
MKYAFALDIPGEQSKWTLTPWRLRGLVDFESVRVVPDGYTLVVSHFAPWWSPLKEYIAEGRPYIEIEYGYWGPDTPRRQTRRVTYCGHHNVNNQRKSYSRQNLFMEPRVLPWKTTPGSYVLVIQPVDKVLLERTGETLDQFRQRITELIRPHWNGPIKFRRKVGPKNNRFATLIDDVSSAYAVVGERTMACVESCLLGTPAFTVDHTVTSLLMGGIENLASLKYPDRSDWFEHICWSQFTIDEFSTSVPADITEQYQINQ